jgi:uncharacterized protein YbjT (DUF2867 family)
VTEHRTILVTGATGAQGGSVARHLLAAGRFSVRGLTRKPNSEAALALKRAGAEIVQGDMDDIESLRKAVQGCYGVFGVTSFWEHFDKEYAQGENLVDAVAGSKTQHFIFSSLPSVKKVAPDLNVPHLEMKAAIEQHARIVGIPSTFINVAFYFENFLGFFPPRKGPDGAYAFGFPQGDTPLAAVSVEDVGGIVARLFERREEFLGKTVGIAGDELTAAKYAEIMTRELGKLVVYNHIPREVFAKFGFPGAEDLADMFEFFRTYTPSRRDEIARCRSLYPGLQSFDRWLAKNKAGFLTALAA